MSNDNPFNFANVVSQIAADKVQVYATIDVAKPNDAIAETGVKQKLFFESTKDDQYNSTIGRNDEYDARAQAMAHVLTFVEEGGSTAEELDTYALGLADTDEDGEVSKDEQDDYEQAQKDIAEALKHLGVDSTVIIDALDGDDDAAEKIQMHVAGQMDDIDDDDEYIARYAAMEPMMMEAMEKIWRNGEPKLRKRKLKKRRMSSAQRASLKKARRKAHSGKAKRKRRKSMKRRHAAGK